MKIFFIPNQGNLILITRLIIAIPIFRKYIYRKINVSNLSIHGEKSGRGMARFPRHIQSTKRRKKFLLGNPSITEEVIINY